MLKEVKYNDNQQIFELEDKKIYGIPLSMIHKRTIKLNTFNTSNKYVEISDKPSDEYASMVIYNNGLGKNEDAENTMNYVLWSKSLELPDDIVLCMYNKNNDSFIEPSTNIEMPFHTDDNENEDKYYDSKYYENFENEYNSCLKNPLIVMDDWEHKIYEDNEDLRKIALNEKHKEKLRLLEQEAKLNLVKQFDKTKEIDQIVATFEDNLKHDGMSL